MTEDYKVLVPRDVVERAEWRAAIMGGWTLPAEDEAAATEYADADAAYLRGLLGDEADD